MHQVNPHTALPRILLVEDHDLTRRMQIRFLSRDYAVDFASTGEEAFEVALDHDYATILIDINLAGTMSGVEVMQALKRTEMHHETPMIAVTGCTLPRDRERLIQVGFDLYLAKPFRWQEFAAAIRHAVNLSEGHPPRHSGAGRTDAPPASFPRPIRPYVHDSVLWQKLASL